MNFELTDTQMAFQKIARDFAEREIAPFAAAWDAECFHPVETLRKAASQGFAGITVDEAFGGSGLTVTDSVLIFEELATACPSTAAWLSIHNMVASLLNTYADDAQKQAWLPRLCTLETLASYCLTEPGSGSDAASLVTTAKREGEYYILNGAKSFISGGSVSNIYLCMARTGPAGPSGISCFLVEKDTEGLHFGKQESKLGWHSQPTCMVFLDHCRIPVSQRIGKEGEGFRMALSALNGGRLNISACSLGGARTCLELSKRHLHDRKQFGRRLAEFEALQFRFADMVAALDAARLMVFRAADSLTRKDPRAPYHCAMAKKMATDTGFEVCNQSLQLFGGYGYTRDYAIERFFRDLRVHTILEGTNEIMRLIIARHALDLD